MGPAVLLRRLNEDHYQNVKFNDFTKLVEAFGFRLYRTLGSHRSYAHPGIAELIVLVPENGQAQDYQIRQFLRLVKKLQLPME
jgi:predicted RNA binding protein YcfA (HicA-like mRNA interferase family)